MKQEAFDITAPIPGQSLLSEPGNAPYEQAPEIVDPEQALMGHINFFNDADILEAVIEGVNFGFDIETLVEGYLRASVMEGIHTVDVTPRETFIGELGDLDEGEEPTEEPVEEEQEAAPQGLMARGT